MLNGGAVTSVAVILSESEIPMAIGTARSQLCETLREKVPGSFRHSSASR